MDDLALTIKGICIASAGIFLMENLVGGTRLKNQMKLLMKLVLAILIIYPFVKEGCEFEMPEISAFEQQDFSDMTAIYNEELKRQSAENISSVLRDQIAAAGINCDKIEIDVNISEDSIISISKVIITADDFEAAASIVRSSVGSETEVVNGNV